MAFFIEAGLVDARICYNFVNEKKLNAVSFRQKVIDGFLEGFVQKRIRKGHFSNKEMPLIRNIPENQHFLRKFGGKSKPNCVVCSVLPSKCKKQGKGDCKKEPDLLFLCCLP